MFRCGEFPGRVQQYFSQFVPSLLAILISRFMFGLRRLGSVTGTTIQTFSYIQELVWRVPSVRLDAIEMVAVREVHAPSH